MGQISFNSTEINNYRFYKQNILESTPITTESEIYNLINKYLGIHSARIGKPYISLLNKGVAYNLDNIYSTINSSQDYTTIRCMRKTLHLCSLEKSSILHNSTKALRISKKFYTSKLNLISISQDKIQNKLYDKTGMSANDMYIFIKEKCNVSLEEAKTLFKYHWENGLLTMRNESNSVFKEKRVFYLTEAFYGIKLHSCHENEQYYINTLVLDYINHFGPASLKDICWWSGIGTTKIQKALRDNKNLLDIIICEGIELYLINGEVDKIGEFLFLKQDNWCKFLSFEDSALKAYYETRTFYTDEQFIYFNSIGEVYFTILYNGRCVGKWSINHKDKTVCIEVFSKNVSNSIINEEKIRIEKLIF